jgi:hypothetical protein
MLTAEFFLENFSYLQAVIVDTGEHLLFQFINLRSLCLVGVLL